MSTDDRLNEIESLRTRLAELEGETVAEVEETLSEAEESVVEVAEESHEEVSEAHETVGEASHEVTEAVREQAQEVADDLGHPELAGQIADELFRRIDERGLLPQHASHPVTETEHVVTEVPAEATAEVHEVTPDTAPEPQHWYYRPLRRKR